MPLDFANPTPSQVDAVMITGVIRLLMSKRHPVRLANAKREIEGIRKVAEPMAELIETLKARGLWPQQRQLLILGGPARINSAH